jgi:hypothetical protein
MSCQRPNHVTVWTGWVDGIVYAKQRSKPKSHEKVCFCTRENCGSFTEQFRQPLIFEVAVQQRRVWSERQEHIGLHGNRVTNLSKDD